MTTIEDYIKFTDEMRETGLLSADFHIIQYSEGCCLGINGKSLAFEDRAADNRDYVFWTREGYAFSIADGEDFSPAFNEDGSVLMTKTPRLEYSSSLNLPTAQRRGLEGLEDKVDDVVRMLRQSGFSFYLMFTNNNDNLVNGRFFGSQEDWACSLLSSMTENERIAAAVMLAARAYAKSYMTKKHADPNVS